MSLRSVQFVRSVKLLTVKKEELTVRKLHVIIDTQNIRIIFGFADKVLEGFVQSVKLIGIYNPFVGCKVPEAPNVCTVRSLRTVRGALNSL